MYHSKEAPRHPTPQGSMHSEEDALRQRGARYRAEFWSQRDGDAVRNSEDAWKSASVSANVRYSGSKAEEAVPTGEKGVKEKVTFELGLEGQVCTPWGKRVEKGIPRGADAERAVSWGRGRMSVTRHLQLEQVNADVASLAPPVGCWCRLRTRIWDETLLVLLSDDACLSGEQHPSCRKPK